MDRERLSAWLDSPHRTWRWRDQDSRDGSGNSECYDGVSTSDDGLKWFRWSHVFDFAAGEGEHEVTYQSFEAFRAEGPARDMPDPLRKELATWIREHRAG